MSWSTHYLTFVSSQQYDDYNYDQNVDGAFLFGVIVGKILVIFILVAIVFGFWKCLNWCCGASARPSSGSLATPMNPNNRPPSTSTVIVKPDANEIKTSKSCLTREVDRGQDMTDEGSKYIEFSSKHGSTSLV